MKLVQKNVKYFITTIFLLLINYTNGQEIFNSIKSGNEVDLETLLKNGEETEQFNENGLTPLWMAVFNNDTTSVKILIENGANVNGLTEKGLTPIIVGSMANAKESVRILLDNGADVNWKSPAVGNQEAIRFASKNGTVEFIKMLLDAGADMESTANDGGTPLLAAVYSNNYNLAKFYFDMGAKVNILARDGECIILEAIKTKNPKMVELALQYNCPLDFKDGKGLSTKQIADATGNKKIKNLIKNALK
ncbi:ankyrin repeat domain-containing protein [Nonlabens sp. Hel1_33_55]|uniref:ankyrin repeat domain-containing protein n=1 Tax=Nonlabens sp. Hel1_33_55 TaxID=1336802 RepID=UPI000B83827F|nr:ankyrin repeat domain-containing protein [Nonlabens sp. Hel1_33_55]